MSFDDHLKNSLRVLLQEETKKMEAKAREEVLRMEARTKQLVEAEREHFLSQLSQLIPNFDPSMLKPRISQSPKNPMSDKASCSGGDGKHQEEEKKDTAKNGEHQEDEEKEEEKKDEEKEEEKHDDKFDLICWVKKHKKAGSWDLLALPESRQKKEILSVKMVSQHQSKDSGSKKNEGKELGMVAPQDKSSMKMKSSKKMKFASSSAETEPTSQTTISDDSKSGRGMSTMPRVVKRKLQKLRPIVEYNKRGKGIGQAHSEMQSYIGVLARSRVQLVDMKWSQIPKDIKEQIWEAVDMAFVVGHGGKNSVLSSAAKKWKDFKSTLTRHYILPYTNDKEKLSQPPETYKFIEKAQCDAFVASRLSKDFESVHSQHAQIREKLEYNHRLSRKGYAGLEDQLEETMPGVEIDRSTLWKRARQDKHGNIPRSKGGRESKINCKPTHSVLNFY
ncbi:hypothetical protein L3X38_027680 [Prunus dulcis]|uniref:Non-ATPase subunit 9 n=1 Tax=Prunus dulcis TaxID=3755 RepID=A0AAD4Z1D7_PRUDU|nr:hypothetical protein L3X38_027680 [Prunus dulcis]